MGGGEGKRVGFIVKSSTLRVADITTNFSGRPACQDGGVCVCVYVCVCERERERERGGGQYSLTFNLRGTILERRPRRMSVKTDLS